MAQRNVTTSGSHLAKALVTPTGATTDVTLAKVAQAALSVASADAAGRVELATSTETATGQDATRAVTPAGLAAQKFIKSTDVTYKALNDNVAVGSGSSQVARGNHGHAAATATAAGYLSAADKTKLDAIEAKATADQTGAEIVAAVNAELGGTLWQQGGGSGGTHTHSAADLPDRGAFYGKALGASLTDKNSTVDVNIAGLPAKAAAAGTDLVPVWDPQAAAHRHVPVAGLPAGRGIVAPAGDDPAISMELPAAVNRRDFLLGFTATGAAVTTQVATVGFLDALAAESSEVHASIYIDPVHGNDKNNGRATGAALKTFSAAMSIVRPGDTVWLADGIYAERLVVTASGTEAARITFQAINRHQVKIRGKNDGSWLNKIEVKGQHYISFIGLDASHPNLIRNASTTQNSYWLRIENSSNILLEDCLFLHGGIRNTTSWVGSIVGSTDIVFRACTFRKGQTPNSFVLSSGSRFLFEGCCFGEALHDPCQLGPSGEVHDIIFRGCVWIGNWGRNGEIYNAFDLLFEDSLIAHGKDGAMSGSSEAKISGTRTIFRNNMILENWGGAIEQYPYSDIVPNNNSRYYNNIIAGNMQWGWRPGEVYAEDWFPHLAHRTNDMRYFNNVFMMNDIYNLGNPFRFDAPVSAKGKEKIGVYRNAVFNGTYPSEFAWAAGQPANLIPQIKSDDIGKSQLTNNIIGNPSFSNWELWNFSATVISYLRNNGYSLATAVGSGTGTILPVSDVFSFYPGKMIANIVDPGDVVVVGATKQIARVIGRDTGASTLTLDRAVDWEDGDAVGFAWSGVGPDIGLVEHGTGARPTVQVVATARRVEPGTSVTLSLSARGFLPVSAEWWIGNTVKKSGLVVTHTFTEQDDHAIRVRVKDVDGTYRWGVYLVTCKAPRSAGAPLLSFTFDDATDETWWWQWKTYKPLPATPATDVLDGDLGRQVLEVACPSGTNPMMPCSLYPELWDIAEYPVLYVRYKCASDVPLTIRLATFARSDSLASRNMVVAATSAAGSFTPTPPVALTGNGTWREVAINLATILSTHWAGKPTIIKGIEIGCWGTAPKPGMTYRLANVELRR